MTWAHIAAPLFAWLSGALFWASVRPRRSARREPTYGHYPADASGFPGWLRNPRILFQLALLGLFVVGALGLIVVSL
jgi:hypothetical protein